VLLHDSGGRSGYLLKDRVADLDELTDAIRRIARGGVVIDPAVVAELLSRRRPRDPLQDLSDRERDVLRLMAEGRSNQAIGDRLFLSPRTVEAHIRSIFTKLALSPAPRGPPAGPRRARLPRKLARWAGPNPGDRDHRFLSAARAVVP
jgi:DNA-binding NarL/FixJ family response regulator